MTSARSKWSSENIILVYTLLWTSSLILIVHWKLYEHFNPNDYLTLSLVCATPCFLLPVIFADKVEKGLLFHQRFSTKANVFIGIISYIGNHFFTHYFYNVLGMRYTGPLGEGEGIEINRVPLSMYFMTHVYFMSYHVIITKILRFILACSPNTPVLRLFILSVSVFTLAVLTALIETFTISSFPYYTYPDYHLMLTKGSVFYSILLTVTFALFYHLDEDHPWSMTEVIFSALGGMMLVLLLADYWRLTFGSTVNNTKCFDIPYG